MIQDAGQLFDRVIRQATAVNDHGRKTLGSPPTAPIAIEEGAARRHGSDRPCSAGPPCARAPWRAQNKLLRTRLEPSCGLVPSFRAPEALHTCTHMRPHTARTRLHVPTATPPPLFQPDCATKRAPTSTRSIGFCAIWVCISSSSSSHPAVLRGPIRATRLR